MAKQPHDKFVVNGNAYDPYALDKMKKVPIIVKICFLKFWASGATYYFVGWGLGQYIPSVYDQLVVIGITLGLVMEYIINKIISYMDSTTQPTKKYRIVKSNNVKALFINIFWGLFFTTLIIFSYELLNIIALNITNFSPEKVLFPVGPIGFGLLYLLFETITLLIVNQIRKEKPHDG